MVMVCQLKKKAKFSEGWNLWDGIGFAGWKQPGTPSCELNGASTLGLSRFERNGRGTGLHLFSPDRQLRISIE